MIRKEERKTNLVELAQVERELSLAEDGLRKIPRTIKLHTYIRPREGIDAEGRS